MTWQPGEEIIPLSPDGDELRIQVWHASNSYEIEYFSIQLVAVIEGQQQPVTRFDNSHGSQPHRDILNRDGSTLDKITMPAALTITEAFHVALEAMTHNWRAYLDDYLRRR